MFAKSLKGAQHIGEVIADTPQHIESTKREFLLVSNHVNLSQQDIRLIEAICPLFTSSSNREQWLPFSAVGNLSVNCRPKG